MVAHLQADDENVTNYCPLQVKLYKVSDTIWHHSTFIRYFMQRLCSYDRMALYNFYDYYYYLDIETIAVQHTAIQLHDCPLCLIFHHHVLKQRKSQHTSVDV